MSPRGIPILKKKGKTETKNPETATPPEDDIEPACKDPAKNLSANPSVNKIVVRYPLMQNGIVAL